MEKKKNTPTFEVEMVEELEWKVAELVADILVMVILRYNFFCVFYGDFSHLF